MDSTVVEEVALVVLRWDATQSRFSSGTEEEPLSGK